MVLEVRQTNNTQGSNPPGDAPSAASVSAGIPFGTSITSSGSSPSPTPSSLSSFSSSTLLVSSSTTSSSTSSEPSTSSSSTFSSSSSVDLVVETSTSTVAPATTLVFTNTAVPVTTSTSTPLTSAPPVSNASVSGSSKSGFWQNKGAAAGTFTFVALIIVALLAGVFVTIMKKRNARKETRLHDQLFNTTYREPSDYRTNSPGPSINDGPMDPFRREVVYDNTAMSQGHSSDHSHFVPTIPTVQVSAPVQHPDFYNPQRYLPPSQAHTVARLKHDSAQSGYQPSFDSFYGAEQPSGQR